MSSGGVSNPTTATQRPPTSSALSMKIPARHDAGGDHDSDVLASSMPIRIPTKPDSPERPAAQKTIHSFVPPHLMEREGDDFGLFSPSSLRKEQLLRRNEILRSTGFIENKMFTATSGSEIFDAVKDIAMERLESRERSVPKSSHGTSHVRASSLTAALGTN